MSWIHAHQPQQMNEVIGQQSAVKKLADAVARKQPVLLHGSSGTGKTSAVYALAQEMDYELLELNASDVRNKNMIEDVLKSALEQRSLFMKEKLLLIDELDGISGTKDRGGLQALMKLLKKPPVAVVLVANDIWDKKFYGLRKSAVSISFNALNYLSIANILESICKKENIAYEKEDLKTIARRSDGDARAAINDLQILATDGVITKEDISLLGDRDRTQKLHDALMRVFKTLDFTTARTAFDDVQEDYQKILLLLDENIPKEYNGKDLVRAYEALSKADIFSARIRRRQDWRYLVYIFFLLSVGVAFAKEEKYKGFTRYALTSERVKKLFMGKQKHALRRQISTKLAEAFHCSTHEIEQEVLPLFLVFAKKFNKEEWSVLTQMLELTEDELSYIQETQTAQT